MFAARTTQKTTDGPFCSIMSTRSFSNIRGRQVEVDALIYGTEPTFEEKGDVFPTGEVHESEKLKA